MAIHNPVNKFPKWVRAILLLLALLSLADLIAPNKGLGISLIEVSKLGWYPFLCPLCHIFRLMQRGEISIMEAGLGTMELPQKIDPLFLPNTGDFAIHWVTFDGQRRKRSSIYFLQKCTVYRDLEAILIRELLSWHKLYTFWICSTFDFDYLFPPHDLKIGARHRSAKIIRTEVLDGQSFKSDLSKSNDPKKEGKYMGIQTLSSIMPYEKPPSPLTQGPLLKAEEVAKILNISTSLAYKLMLTERIPTVRFNRTVRVKPADLDEFINNSWSASED